MKYSIFFTQPRGTLHIIPSFCEVQYRIKRVFTLQIKVFLLLRYLGWLLQCFVAPCVYIVVLLLFSCLCFVLVESFVDYHRVLLPLFCCPWLCYKLIVHPSVLPPLDSSPTLNLSRLSSFTHNYDHWLEHEEMQDSRVFIAIHLLSLRTFRGFEVLRFPNLLSKKYPKVSCFAKKW